jgi:hypothetical protein
LVGLRPTPRRKAARGVIVRSSLRPSVGGGCAVLELVIVMGARSDRESSASVTSPAALVVHVGVNGLRRPAIATVEDGV